MVTREQCPFITSDCSVFSPMASWGNQRWRLGGQSTLNFTRLDFVKLVLRKIDNLAKKKGMSSQTEKRYYWVCISNVAVVT